MKKISLLVTSILGAAGGYMLSNKKLRTELKKSKNMNDGLSKVMKHLKKDGQHLGGDLQKIIQHEKIQKPLDDAKAFMSDKVDDVKAELTEQYDSLSSKIKKKPTTVVKKKTPSTTIKKTS